MDYLQSGRVPCKGTWDQVLLDIAQKQIISAIRYGLLVSDSSRHDSRQTKWSAERHLWKTCNYIKKYSRLVNKSESDNMGAKEDETVKYF